MVKPAIGLFVLLFGLVASLFLVKQVQVFVQKASEGPVSTLTGVLTYEVSEGNPKTNTPSVEKYYLILSDGTKIQVDPSLIGGAKIGTAVTIQGITRGDMLSSSLIQKTGAYSLAAPKASTGTRKVAVVLVNFANKTLTTPTKASVQSLITGEFANFYKTSSYNKFILNEKSTDVYGPYTINSNYICSSTAYNNIYLSALNLADADINYSNYSYDIGNGMLGSNVIFVFPSDSTCSLNGFANSNFKVTNDGAFTFYMSYIPSNVFGLRTVAHEFGHNLGLKHAAAYDCGSSSFIGSCTTYEYGDPWDLMGAWNYDSNPQVPDTARDFSASRKEELGWLNSSNILDITSTGSRSLYALESSTSNIKALKVKKNNDVNNQDYFYIESRIPPSGNVDQGIESSALNGVIVRLVQPSGSSYNTSLYDMHPNSNSGINADFKDSALQPQETFSMPGGPYNNGLVITLNSKSLSTGIASVYFGVGGSQNPPTVDLKANGVDGPLTVSAGAQVTLSWSSLNTSSCTASGSWSGSKTTSGSLSVTVTTSGSYVLTCTGTNGSVSDSVDITVQTASFDTSRCWDRTVFSNSTYYWSDACTGIFNLYKKTSTGKYVCSVTSFRAPPQLSSSELTERNIWVSVGSPKTPCQ